MIVLWLQGTKSYYCSFLCPPSPVSSFPQQVSLGEIPTSHLDRPHSAVKTDTHALALSNILSTALPTTQFH